LSLSLELLKCEKMSKSRNIIIIIDIIIAVIIFVIRRRTNLMMRNLKSLYTPRAISARIVNTVFCLFEWTLERTLKKVKHRISHF